MNKMESAENLRRPKRGVMGVFRKILSALGFRKKPAAVPEGKQPPAEKAALPPTAKPAKGKKPAKAGLKKPARKPKAGKAPARPGGVKAAKKVNEAKLKKDLVKWKKRVTKLTERIKKLEKRLSSRDISPKEAKGQVRLVYAKLNEESRNIDTDLKYTKALMKRLEGEYFKRRMTAPEFRQKMLEYREKSYLLKLKKGEIKKQKKDTDQIGQRIQEAILVSPQAAYPAQAVRLVKGAVPAGPAPAKRLFAGLFAGKAKKKGREKELLAAAKKAEKEGFVAVPSAAKEAAAGKRPEEKPEAEPEEKPEAEEEREEKPEAAAEAGVREEPKPAEKPEAVREERPKSKPPAEAGNAEAALIRQVIEHKAKGKIDEKKLGKLETKIEGLASKHKISASEIEKGLKGENTRTILASLNRLISLMELEHKADVAAAGRPAAPEVAGYRKKMPVEREIRGVAIEVGKHRIVTDFDKVFSLIKSQGRERLGTISKKLSIGRKRVLECAEILEGGGLVTITYPTIGDPYIQLKDYLPPKNKKKKGGEKSAGQAA
jgi:hypothetical protein